MWFIMQENMDPPKDIKAMLEQFEKGGKENYETIINQLSQSRKMASGALSQQINNVTLSTYLNRLSTCITLLDKHHEHVVQEILRIDWINRDDNVLKEFHRFVCELVTAHTALYLKSILKTIFTSFKIPDFNPSTAEMDFAEKHGLAFSRLHQVLLSVLSMVPGAEIQLKEILSSYYPYIPKTNAYTQECLVKYLLCLAQYPAELVSSGFRCFVFKMIVKHLIELDTIVSREDITQIRDSGDTNENGQDGNMDADKPVILSEAQILHRLMSIMFAYIHQKCFGSNSVLDTASAQKLFNYLLEAFDVLLLPTHASSLVQFLLFYICSFSKGFAEGFLKFLWAKFQSPETAAIYRQTAAAYISGFLARAIYLETRTIRNYVHLMVEWIHSYITASSDAGALPDSKYHGPFHAICQALFYVFVFRGRELLSTANGQSFCRNLKIQRIVSSDLNPLKFCLPTIAHNFGVLMRNNYLATCDSILERNRRCFLPEIGSTSVIDSCQLNTFFPFDRNLLTESSKFISNIYLQYQHISAVSEVCGVKEENSCKLEEDHYMEYENEHDSLHDSFHNDKMHMFLNMS